MLDKKQVIQPNRKRAALFKAALFEAGLTQRDWAKEVGVRDDTVKKYIYGLIGDRSKCEPWAIKKFGELFIAKAKAV